MELPYMVPRGMGARLVFQVFAAQIAVFLLESRKSGQ